MVEYNDEPTRQELVNQAEVVKKSIEATMYMPVAHGEAEKLIQMLEEKATDVPSGDDE